jgi:hypothetical protein
MEIAFERTSNAPRWVRFVIRHVRKGAKTSILNGGGGFRLGSIGFVLRGRAVHASHALTVGRLIQFSKSSGLRSGDAPVHTVQSARS